jgi:Cytochrome oxidase complex assembly protein 1
MQESPGKTKRKGKSWPWLLGCGCGGCSLSLLLPIALFVGGSSLISFVYSHFEDMRQAIALAEQDSRVEEALGVPLEISNWLIHRAYKVKASGDEVSLIIPVAGPKGSGYIYAQGVKMSKSKWHFASLSVKTDANLEIIILSRDSEPAPS